MMKRLRPWLMAVGGLVVGTPALATEPADPAKPEPAEAARPEPADTAKPKRDEAADPESSDAARSEPADTAEPEADAADDGFGDFASDDFGDPSDDAADLESDDFGDLDVESADPDPAREPIPGLPGPGREAATRSGRGLLAAGGVVLGLGVVGRFAIEGFWLGPAALEPGEPFGQWSVPSIMFFTSFANVAVVPGLVLTGFGARRHGAWRAATGARPDPARTERDRRIGWGLLGGGLSLWVATRALGLPVLRACGTNGCAYGYLEATYWASLGLAIPGVVMVGLAAGERRSERRLTAAPLLGPGTRGLALGGRF